MPFPAPLPAETPRERYDRLFAEWCALQDAEVIAKANREAKGREVIAALNELAAVS